MRPELILLLHRVSVINSVLIGAYFKKLRVSSYELRVNHSQLVAHSLLLRYFLFTGYCFTLTLTCAAVGFSTLATNR